MLSVIVHVLVKKWSKGCAIMLEFIINLAWIVIIIIIFLAVVYSLVRLAAIAWHRTKQEYESRLLNYEDYLNRNNQIDQDDEEQ